MIEVRLQRGIGASIVLLLCATVPAHAQYGAKNGEWRTYGGDLGSTRYAPLDQINAANFSKLEVAWRFKTDNLGPQPEFNFQSTPLMVNGVLYTTAGSRRAAVALETMRSAKTLTLDGKTGHILLIAAEFGQPSTPPAGGRPGRGQMVPDSFSIIVVGK